MIATSSGAAKNTGMATAISTASVAGNFTVLNNTVLMAASVAANNTVLMVASRRWYCGPPWWWWYHLGQRWRRHCGRH